MKRIIRDSAVFGEALVNPQYSNSSGVAVRVMPSGEGPIPDVHVFWEGTSNCAFISLQACEYASHHKDKGDVLTKQAKKRFIKNMEMLCPGEYIKDNSGIHQATGYEYAVNTWCNTYEAGDFSKFKFDDSGRLIMPDYSKLTTKSN